MGRYRARDLLLAPNLISLTRIPLAAAFPLAVEDPTLAFAVLALSAASDVIDGWVARKRGLATATGAVLDPVTDKLFVLTVMVTLIVTGHLPLWSAVLLATREIGEAPLVLWWSLSRHRRRARTEEPRANVPGKLATALQFVTVALALFRSPWTMPALFASGGAGAIAAVVYWSRDLRAARGRPPE